MNKKEFIERLINMRGCGAKPTSWARGWDDAISDVIRIAEELDEPNHHKGKRGIEAIDVIRTFGNDDMIAGFYWGNAIEYMIHYRNKNGLEDLKKARKNLDWLIEHMEGF